MKDRFWIKRITIWRIVLELVRNDGIVGKRRSRVSFMADCVGGQMFCTVRFGSLFLNMDVI